MTGTDPLADARRALHLDVTCPLCGAEAGHPCRSLSGKARSSAHAGRARADRDRLPVCWVQPELSGPGDAP